MKTKNKNSIKECTFFVEGMHCPSCEVLIEKKLLDKDRIEAVEASTAKGEIRVEYQGKKPTISELNKIFAEDNYSFSEEKIEEKDNKPAFKFEGGKLIVNREKLSNGIIIFVAVLAVLVIYSFITKSSMSSMINVNSSSSLPGFFLFGLIAGFSSCAALVGGVVLSMSKQWSELYDGKKSSANRFEPHLLFNIGRIFSYFVLGGVLGLLGKTLQISVTFSSLLMIGVSIMMIFFALQMLGVKAFQKFQLTMPKFVTRYVADENNFKGRYMPFIMGALTFFLPCGFTITAQGLALASGSFIQGALIMLFFALGTLPMLLFIGFSSVEFSKRPHLSNTFLKVAGVLVLLFGIFNLNSGFNVLGAPSLNDYKIFSQKAQASEGNLPPLVDGKQILKMNATAGGYEPNKLKIRAGIPVRWEITDKGTSGCTNAVVSKSLFDGEIKLTPGQTSAKEFTADKPGIYKFSCWMGMVSGTIEVVDEKGNSGNSVVPAGNDGSGCGMGGGGGCGCGRQRT